MNRYEQMRSNQNAYSENSSDRNPPTPWFSTNELLEYLGISKRELMSQLNSFTEGIHYKLEKKNRVELQMLWRVDLINELLCLPIPPLEKEAMEKAINNHITCTSYNTQENKEEF